MALKERLLVLRWRELDVAHSGVAEHHREAVNLRLGTVETGVATLRPVALRHLAGFGFVPDFGEDGDHWLDLVEVVAKNGCFADVSLFLDLFKETDTAQARILFQPLPDVRLVGIPVCWVCCAGGASREDSHERGSISRFCDRIRSHGRVR